MADAPQRATFFLDLRFLGDEQLDAFDRVPTEFWALPRPLTRGCGSGKVWERIEGRFGRPDVAFGVRDGIPADVLGVDRNRGYEWAKLPFADRQFVFGYWDPPYDKMYRREAREIWRTCNRLAILHTHVYPRAWFQDARREAMVALTMGPLKRVRILQLFNRQEPSAAPPGRHQRSGRGRAQGRDEPFPASVPATGTTASPRTNSTM